MAPQLLDQIGEHIPDPLSISLKLRRQAPTHNNLHPLSSELLLENMEL